MRLVIGIDNGVTGSIGIIYDKGHSKSSAFVSTPVVEVKNYTKEDQNLHRIDWRDLVKNLPPYTGHLNEAVYIERPMVNPKAFKATQSALRALEATLIVLEMLGYEQGVSYFFVDSKEWQKEFIASSAIGREEMKKASKEIGMNLFPSNGGFIQKHGDADGLLIAEWARRKK